MDHSEFHIGTEFVCGERRWRCTDVGQRTIAAICLNDGHDESWFRGPPYAVVENIFDEYDLPGCQTVPPDWQDFDKETGPPAPPIVTVVRPGRIAKPLRRRTGEEPCPSS